MTKKLFLIYAITFLTTSLIKLSFSQETPPAEAPSPTVKTIKLPSPDLNGGKMLMQALKDRHSTRSFSTKELPLNILSNLLWAARGINRTESHGITVPSAHNWQEIDVYVAKKEALYIYDPNSHSLYPVLKKDIRKDTGIQKFTEIAPINLIYVANFPKMTGASIEEKTFYSGIDTGFISQNVYLFCASENLATVVLGWVDKEKLEQAMHLTKDKKVILTQPVGFHKK